MPKTQDVLDRERDEARQRADQAALDAKTAADEHEAALRDAALADNELERASIGLEEALEVKRKAEALLPKEKVGEAIERAKGSLEESVDEGQPPSFGQQDEQKATAQFSKELEEGKARVARAEQKVQEATSIKQEAAEKARKAHEVADTKAQAKATTAEALRKALKEAAVAAELALQGVKKKVRWLAWDGTRGGGTGNTYPADPNSVAAQARAAFANRTTVLTVPAKDGNSKSATLYTPTTVSVRIVSCTAGPFLPVGGDRATVEVELKRMHLIKSLLFRVLDAHGAVVYQEALNEAQLDALPDTALAAAAPRPTGAVDAATELQARLLAVPPGPNGGLAQPADGPYQFRVWVSNQANAFAGLATNAQPAETYGSQVHDQSLRGAPKTGQSDGDYQNKKAKVERNQAGINQTQVRRTRLINLAIHLKSTKHTQATNQTVPQKIQELTTALQDANGRFQAMRPGELRVLLGPEWYFQKVGAPFAHTLVERDAIVQALEQLSGTPVAQGWLLAPGTILYGEPLAHSGALAVFNMLPVVAGGASVRHYHKRQWGSDTEKDCTSRTDVNTPPWSSVGFELAANGNEKRASKLDKGRFPPSLGAPMRATFGSSSRVDGKTVATVTAGQKWTIQSDGESFVCWKPGKKLLRMTRRDLFALPVEDATAWTEWVGNTLARANYLGSNFFTHANLRFAVEICADHAGGRAASEYTAGDGHALGGPVADDGVDVHLVSSAGVNVFDWKIASRTGGFYAWVDSDVDDAASVKTSVKKVTARTAAVTAVGLLARNARATQQAQGQQFAPARPPVGGTPVTTQAVPVTLAGTVKCTSMLLEEV